MTSFICYVQYIFTSNLLKYIINTTALMVRIYLTVGKYINLSVVEAVGTYFAHC